MNDWKKCKYSKSAFFKMGLGGMVDWKSESQTELKRESYVSGRIDSKTVGIHYVSYTPTSESCKLSNKTKWKKFHSEKCNVFTHVTTLWIWESYENLCKCKLQIIEMYKKAKYCKFVSKAKICKIWIV